MTGGNNKPYNIDMRNWSVDETKLRHNPKKYQEWKLEQQLVYGLDDGEKIDRKMLLKNWLKLKPRLDINRRNFIQFLLWS